MTTSQFISTSSATQTLTTLAQSGVVAIVRLDRLPQVESCELPTSHIRR